MSVRIQSQPFTIKEFDRFFRGRLERNFHNALLLFMHYREGDHGDELSQAFVTALTLAVEHGKVPEVLKELDEHWEKILQYENPHIRGAVGSIINGPMTDTDFAFKRIYEDILGIR